MGVAGEAPELVGGGLSDFIVSGLALAKFSDGVVDQPRLADNTGRGFNVRKDREFYSRVGWAGKDTTVSDRVVGLGVLD